MWRNLLAIQGYAIAVQGYATVHGYVSMAHACTAQAAADPRKASYCHGTLFQTISARPADSGTAPPAFWVTKEGATTSWQAPNEGRREKNSRHHKHLSSCSRSLAKGTDVLITLSPETTTWLILHVFSSLEEEGKDKESVNNTQYSTNLKDRTPRHSCWFH